jgi:hypothetical protein
LECLLELGNLTPVHIKWSLQRQFRSIVLKLLAVTQDSTTSYENVAGVTACVPHLLIFSDDLDTNFTESFIVTMKSIVSQYDVTLICALANNIKVTAETTVKLYRRMIGGSTTPEAAIFRYKGAMDELADKIFNIANGTNRKRRAHSVVQLSTSPRHTKKPKSILKKLGSSTIIRPRKTVTFTIPV